MSVTHRSIGVINESTFGSLNPSTGLPTTSGLNFVSIPCERDPIIIYGEPVASERNDARDGSYGLPPEPDTVYSSGSRVRRRTGQVVIQLDLTTIGSAADNYDTNYLGYLLGAGFKTAKHSFTSDTPTGVANVNLFTPTTAESDFTIGGLIGVEVAGRAEYSAVTNNDESGAVSISPALSALTPSDTVRAMQTWYPGSRTNTGEKVSSVAFEVNGVDFKTICFGCVLESLSITLDNGRVMGEFTFQSACIQDDHGNASGPVEPSYNTGAPPFFRGSYVVVSSTSPTSLTNASGTGDKLARTKLDCEDFTLTITNTLTPLGHSDSILAMSEMEISDVDVELNLTLTTLNTTINSDYFNRTVRQVLVGTGPNGDGKGCAFMLPAAYLTNDPSAYDVSGNDIVRQTLNYKQTRFGGDVSETGAGNSPLRIALGV
ncbi:MAG: hypothetical protein GOVbin564_6 [Prokaryotic dsDNA virus sp.]|nr:MAG: hypothetical protein GOVbin564_6 [Prokaryotic dsDNA virus sp.]|tara:strand:+ start:18702 stop:19994 length:1293 start_codon:yes stop_codon:yes gene_type:complete